MKKQHKIYLTNKMSFYYKIFAVLYKIITTTDYFHYKVTKNNKNAFIVRIKTFLYLYSIEKSKGKVS